MARNDSSPFSAGISEALNCLSNFEVLVTSLGPHKNKEITCDITRALGACSKISIMRTLFTVVLKMATSVFS